MKGNQISSVVTLPLLALLCIVAGIVVPACNNVPVRAITTPVSIQNEVTDVRPEIPKIDILFVIDNSNSMCEEQINLTRNFKKFIEDFQKTIQADFQIAVVTSFASNKNTERGKFQVKQGSYEICDRKFTFDCIRGTDGDNKCVQNFGTGWECTYTGSKQKFSNGKVNSFCVKRCGPDSTAGNNECNTEFGTDGPHICFAPGTDFSACRLQTDTTGCENFTIPGGIITNNTQNLDAAFRCIATVGTVSGGEAQIEMGLLAAQLALNKGLDPKNPDAPNKDQAINFVREDAFLAIVFVSDEDDCSTETGDVSVFGEDFARCAFKADKLRPVGEFVKFFKRLKKDPGKVIVAAISGDAKIQGLDTSSPGFNLDARVIQEREAYITSKNTPGDEGTYICVSQNGRSDYGSRYRELVDKFGSNGVFASICDDDFGPALAKIRDKIIEIFLGSCLTRPVKLGGLRLPGEACTSDDQCVYKVCRNEVCESLAELNEACTQASDCYSGSCTNNLCDCPGNSCPNKYAPYKKFIGVKKTLKDGTSVDLTADTYRIQEQSKCIQENNPKGLAVVPNDPPEAGSTVKILYESEALSN